MAIKIEPATQLVWDCDQAFPVDDHNNTCHSSRFEYDAALTHAFLEMIEEVRSDMGDNAADAFLEYVASAMDRYGYECPLLEVPKED